jgi:hypothetical protein
MHWCAISDDVVASLRRILRHPQNYVLLVLALAVSLGCVIGLFDVARELLHGRLPYRDPDRLVVGDDTLTSLYLFNTETFQPNPLLDSVFEKAAMYHLESANLNTAAVPQRILVASITPQFFSTLGVGMELGQDFADRPLPSPHSRMPWLPVVISHRLWSNAFGRDPEVVRKSVTLDIRPHHFQVVGVAPPGVSFPPGVDAWIPEHSHSFSIIQTARVSPVLSGSIGLLPSGFSASTANSRIRTWRQRSRAGWAGPLGNVNVQLLPIREFLGGAILPPRSHSLAGDNSFSDPDGGSGIQYFSDGAGFTGV